MPTRCFAPVSLLKSVVLPVFGFPARAILAVAVMESLCGVVLCKVVSRGL